MATLRKKLVIVGDGACGKTSLLMYLSNLDRLTYRVFKRGQFTEQHIPTVFDTYVQDVRLQGSNTTVQFAMWDTAGQEDFDRLRSLCYPDADIILICFSLDNYDSLQNVVDMWQPEVLQYTGHLKVPFILVGTKRDLRRGRGDAVSYLEGEAIARRIGARGYVECSARLNEGVTEVFQFAAKEACRERHKKFCTIL
jgi:Ras homolog gene family, member A